MTSHIAPPAAAQYLHRIEVAINRGAEGKTGRYFVADISEEKALALSSKFVSETFLFSVRAFLQHLPPLASLPSIVCHQSRTPSAGSMSTTACAA